MTEAVNLEALQKATTAAVLASIMPGLPIAFLGRTFTPPNDQKYLETVFIPNNPASMFWGSEKAYRGFFRLILHWPKDDQGAYAPLRLCESIASYFKKDRLLGEIQITDEPNLKSPIAGVSDMLYPMSVRYSRLRLT